MQIPILSVQPLIENAIKHGIALRSEPGYVRLKGECCEGELRISIVNSTAEISTGRREAASPGVGLQNVRRRLEICYGCAAALDLSSEGAETLALLRVPVSAPAGESQSFGGTRGSV
ncbi:MAG TPA: hypothetical protein VMA31_16455 [Bryobacteraceae bacterium]|nr:hypothetical protein [Bryobacteraceae bacterium]